MSRNFNRSSGKTYSLCLQKINGEDRDDLKHAKLIIENIGRGGFRFHADVDLEIEDRVRVLLKFPSGQQHEVLGRICYRELIESDELVAYGFSVLQGFYKPESIPDPHA
jgi:hypothetical protein